MREVIERRLVAPPSEEAREVTRATAELPLHQRASQQLEERCFDRQVGTNDQADQCTTVCVREGRRGDAARQLCERRAVVVAAGQQEGGQP